MEDNAIMFYLRSQAKYGEEEVKAKFKAIRFFKGKLEKDEMIEYNESLERHYRKGQKLDTKEAKKKEKLRRAKQAQDRASNVWTEDTSNNTKLNVLIYVE